MKKKNRTFQKTAIGFLAGLVLVSLLLIVPVSADAGEVVAWGRNYEGQCSGAPTDTGFTQVSAGLNHGLALASDGTIVAWGYDWYGQCSGAPTDAGFTQVSAGGGHSLAIKSAPAPVASISAESSCDEGSAHSFDASGSTNTVADTTYTWTFGDGTDDSGVTVDHTYADNGEYEVTLTVTNPDAQSDTATTTITVINVAPAIESLSVPKSEYVGTAVGASAQFSDPGQDTHAATWDWGDQTGSDSAGTVNEETGEVTGNHIYTTSGDYQVTLTVTDDDGGSVTETATISVKPIPADVSIESDTLNLNSLGIITVFITLPEGYDVAEIDGSTVQCEGVNADKCMLCDEDPSVFLAKFDRNSFADIPTGDAVELTVSGTLGYNGYCIDFEGSDAIRVMENGNGIGE